MYNVYNICQINYFEKKKIKNFYLRLIGNSFHYENLDLFILKHKYFIMDNQLNC